jgi:kinesin family protein 2/24
MLFVQFQVPGMYDGAQKLSYGGGLDDSDKHMSKSTILPESNYLKAFPEKEKAAPAAKIKVVVCFSIVLFHSSC